MEYVATAVLPVAGTRVWLERIEAPSVNATIPEGGEAGDAVLVTVAVKVTDCL